MFINCVVVEICNTEQRTTYIVVNVMFINCVVVETCNTEQRTTHRVAIEF